MSQDKLQVELLDAGDCIVNGLAERYILESGIPHRFCADRNQIVSLTFCSSMLCGDGCPKLSECKLKDTIE